MAEIVETIQDERVKVENWRLHVLIEAGYPVEVAGELAHSNVDLHKAVELVRSGCDASLAATILL